MPNAVGLMLFFSGAAALVYQVVWVRLLGFSIGATAVSVAAVLTAFFGGMALGGLVAQAQLRRGAHGLQRFALAEGVTAIGALLLLPVLFNLDRLLALFPAMDTDSPWQFLLVMLVLLLPSAAIGATFPFLAAWRVQRQERSGHTLSALYAINTLGAMCGALLAGFWLIPRLGLDGATHAAATINGGVVLAAWWLAKRERKAVLPLKAVGHSLGGQGGQALSALAATGFTALAAEVVWSKYLSLYAGTTLYGFSAMTAMMLAGMAGGGWLMQLWLLRKDASFSKLLFMLLLLAAALAVTRSGLGLLPWAVGDTLLLGEALHSPWKFALLTLVLLPSSLCFGATFPLALALHCPNGGAVRHSLGLALAVNILAAIGGAVITSLWLIPMMGSDTTLALLPLLPLAAALALMVHTPVTQVQRAVVISVVVMLGVATVLLPGIDYERVLSSTHYRYAGKTAGETNFRYLGEGRSGLISLVDYGGDLVFLQRNGLNEGAVNGQDARKGTLPESLLGVLTYLLQQQPHDALVVGFGAGVTTRVLAEGGLESVKVVELEPRVVEAMMQLGREQWPFLADGRVHLEFNDARASLRADSHRYSIIVSQPSHPWLAGSANLYSREFFELARSRLRQDGIFGQWVNLFRMDATTLRSILRTFYEVFPRGVVFGMMKSGDLLLMGGDTTMVLDYERSNAFYLKETVNAMLTHAGLHDIRALPKYFLFTSKEALRMAGDASVATDSNLLVEIRLAGLMGPIIDNESPYSLLQKYAQTNLNAYRTEGDPVVDGPQSVPNIDSTEEISGISSRPYRRIH